MAIVNINQFTLEELRAVIEDAQREIDRREKIEITKLQDAFIEAFNACVEKGVCIYCVNSGYVTSVKRDGTYSIDIDS